MANTHTNGVLPINPSQTNPKAQKSTSHNRTGGPKLKVVIRRLAPALTEAEFKATLGDEWASGGGRVDWFSYKVGKDSKDPAKVSRPSRAYLHLTNESHLIALSNHVRQLSFEDAANTYTSSCLLGPPTVEYAPYGRIPSGKRRTDARQGTIDLDPEFMDFLESLANPAPTKEEETDTAKAEKVTTTPLVQYLKDKKASKTKDSGSSKGSKSNRNEQSSSSGTLSRLRTKETTEESPKKTSRESKKEKVEKASREAVRVLNREAAKQTASSSQSQAANTPTEPPKNPRVIARERGSIAAAARILQRDLGLTPGNAHRRAKVEAEAAKSDATLPSTSQQAHKSGQPSSSNNGRERNRGKGGNAQTAENDKPKVAPPTAPMVLLKKPVDNTTTPSGPSGPAASSSRTSTPAARSANTPQPVNHIPSAPAALNKPTSSILSRRVQPVPVPTNGATQAFIKHANPSQGVTEPLLKEAMETFGAVSRVEIDKRKGFAYVDFVDSEGLKKAMAANPTRIAQGTVQVLERKDNRLPREQQAPRAPPQHPKHGHMAGGGGGGGNGGNNGPPQGPSGGGRGPPRRGRGRNAGGAGNSSAVSGSGSAEGAKPSAPAVPTPAK